MTWPQSDLEALDARLAANRTAEQGGATTPPEGPAVRERYPELDLKALLQREQGKREWAVAGFLPAGASVALVAAAGSGKSLLVLAMMLAVVTGQPSFAGLRIPRSRRVLYVDTENTTDDIQERLIDLGVTADTDLSLLHFLHLPALPPLDRADGGAELAAIVQAYGLTAGDIVVLDSTQRVTHGPENDSDTWRAFYRHSGQGLKRAGMTVIRTDNTGKDATRGGRGSSGKRDDVDISWILTADDERGAQLTLHPEKQRIPDVHDILVERLIRPDGTLTYSTAKDPHQQELSRTIDRLNFLGVPADASTRTAEAALRGAGHKVSNSIIREAVRARKSAPDVPGAPLKPARAA